MKNFRIASVAALSIALTAGASLAADYPDRTINMIIPYGPGGATDISARTLAEPLGKVVPEALVMVNRTGAGGATGSVSVKHASADGYTMLFARVGSHTVNPAMKDTLPYTLDDFRFVGVYEINPVACAVRSDSDIDSLDELASKVQAEPGSVTYSSSGVGALQHIASAMVLKSFGVEKPLEQAVHLPMKGGGAAATAVLSGTATFICTNSAELASFVANGQFKPLMVTTTEPVAGFDAPSAASLGHPELEQLVGWTGVAGPKDLPDDIAAKWGEWLAAATADAGFREKMEARGSVIELMSPEDSAAFIQKQYEVFRALVDELGMRISG
ncbi:tripartite tricarboxylate transporter substrate binding protein [Paralimibaculum aggregatum]|uniref:Tripartite tricarboxylate transporter substrate binding protein n=1 Tax=Paralimibaculum aggregatum TaxID=3036245 RepID=A0ABQ6LNR3_9RHOB|nr:tripartite tricarboxylate transporter substrate binding protein [Limibaculum sp. NKW23]GMG84857.1 tripartite tricarboxylate transporter substrate binding protein [Limibaculum sp. NKW23]